MTANELNLLTDAEKVAEKFHYLDYKGFLKDLHLRQPKTVEGYIQYLKDKREQDKLYEYMQREFQFVHDY